jgi:hypothetical protein
MIEILAASPSPSPAAHPLTAHGAAMILAVAVIIGCLGALLIWARRP